MEDPISIPGRDPDSSTTKSINTNKRISTAKGENTNDDDEYSVLMINNSSTAWIFVVYQKPPPSENAVSLAWLASPFHIGTGSRITFSWKTSYQFAWRSTAVLSSGASFQAGGYEECNPDGNNLTEFTMTNDTPAFSEATAGASKGTLRINDSASVPPNTFSVGLAMSEKGIYVESAEPNISRVFTPSPSYWVCALDQVKEGEILNVQGQTSQLNYPANVYNLTATLNSDNTWKVSQQLS